MEGRKGGREGEVWSKVGRRRNGEDGGSKEEVEEAVMVVKYDVVGVGTVEAEADARTLVLQEVVVVVVDVVM